MNAMQALFGFTAWTLLLVTGVFAYRGARFLTGTPINHWPRSNKPGDDAPPVDAANLGVGMGAHLTIIGPSKAVANDVWQQIKTDDGRQGWVAVKINGQEVPIPRQVMARGYKLRLTSSSEMASACTSGISYTVKESGSESRTMRSSPGLGPMASGAGLVHKQSHGTELSWGGKRELRGAPSAQRCCR